MDERAEQRNKEANERKKLRQPEEHKYKNDLHTFLGKQFFGYFSFHFDISRTRELTNGRQSKTEEQRSE
jgi:hypothetical protein